MGYGVAVGCGGIGVLVAVGGGGTGVLVAVCGAARRSVSPSQAERSASQSQAAAKSVFQADFGKQPTDGRRPAETGNTKIAASTNTAATNMKREVCFIAT